MCWTLLKKIRKKNWVLVIFVAILAAFGLVTSGIGLRLVLLAGDDSFFLDDAPISDEKTRKYFLIPTPELTTDLLATKEQRDLATRHYQTSLNEESAEIWLHRAFHNNDTSMQVFRTLDPHSADVFLISGLFTLANNNTGRADYAQKIILSLYNTTKPHIVLSPSWNPTRARKTGLTAFIKTLQQNSINIYSVGLERNPYWQGSLPPERIIPIPYVVRPSMSREELLLQHQTSRTSNFVFYAGDARKNAVTWAGCNRSMILPLQNRSDMYVRLITKKHQRLSQSDYNTFMRTSDYCLIVCGDTVTSRSLTSSIIHSCIPIFVGSRWRGLCEAPCHCKWGWAVVGESNPHLPFSHSMKWSEYPEVPEQEFAERPYETLQTMFRLYDQNEKKKLRENMQQHQLGWIYGWGDPVTSNEFGEAPMYVWKSILDTVGLP